MATTFLVNRYFILANNSVACVTVSGHDTKEAADKVCSDLNAAVNDLLKCQLARVSADGSSALPAGMGAGQFLRYLAVKNISHDVVAVEISGQIVRAAPSLIVRPGSH